MFKFLDSILNSTSLLEQVGSQIQEKYPEFEMAFREGLTNGKERQLYLTNWREFLRCIEGVPQYVDVETTLVIFWKLRTGGRCSAAFRLPRWEDDPKSYQAKVHLTLKQITTKDK